MSNPFDQFDTLNTKAANPFDQFDSLDTENAKLTADRPNATLLDTTQQGYSGMKAAEMLDLNRQYRTAIPELEKSAAEAGPLTKWAYDMQLDRNQRGLQETQDYLNQYSEAQKVAPVNPTLEKIQQSKTFGEVWAAVKENPVDAITHGVASSAVPSALMLGNAYLGGRVGGLPGASIAGGAASADVEYKSGVVEGLNQAGVNLGDKQSLDKALDNTSLMDQIDVQAGQKAAVVGALDAASLGVAGKLFPGSALKAAGANAVVQPALGAGGEAGGSVYSGQDIKPGAVALEALGELPGSAVEVALARNARNASKPNQETPEATQDIYADQPPPAQQGGLDMNAVVNRMIGAESAGKADAKNPYSSAEGLGQFIDTTWLKMIKKHRPDLASGKSDQELIDLKTNGALSREMTTRYAEDNMQELQSSGFEATGQNVYLAHHFGVGGARSLLRADPNVPVASVVSAQVIQQNPYMRGKTVGQVLSIIGNKMGEQAGSVAATTNQSVTPGTAEVDTQHLTQPDAIPSPDDPTGTPSSLTAAINPALQAGAEPVQAAQAPTDIPTEPVQPKTLTETVQDLMVPAIEPVPAEVPQAEATAQAVNPVSQAETLPEQAMLEPEPLTDLNPSAPIESTAPVEATPALSTPLFSVAANEAEQFRASLDKALTDRRSVDVPITVGRSPEVFKAVGIPDLPVVISRDTVRKATNGIKHNVPVEVVRNLPALLADPAMIFDSDSVAGAKVIAVESTDASGRPVIVALQVAQKARSNQLEVNRIASIYGRDNVQVMQSWVDKGLLRYAHKQKSQQWFQSGGLQLPNEGITAGTKTNILTNEDLVNRSLQEDSTGRTRSGLSVSEAQTELADHVGTKRLERLLKIGKLVIADQSPAEGVQGSYQNGVVTLYADNIQPGEVWGVFLHEAGEHAGLEQMLGAEKYQVAVSSFDKLVESGNADALQAVDRVPGDTPQQHVNSERLAYLIEAFTNNTLKTGGAKNLVRRVIAAIRAWAFDKLPAWARPRELSVADIQALAVRAARAWARSSSITAESGELGKSFEKQADTNDEPVQYSIKSIVKAITSPNQQRNADGLLQMGRVIINEVVASPHQAIRDIGTPSAQAIADLIRRPMENENSTVQGALDDLNAASYARQGEFSKKLSGILEPLITKRTKILLSFTIPKADREALVRGLHTGIVPTRLVPAAKQLRAWLDELRDYQEAAGLDFGYIKNYFPRVYDLKKVLNNQQDFIAMLQRHGYAPDVAATILARIVNGDTLPEMAMNTTNRLIRAANGQMGTFMPREGGVAGSAGKSGHQQSRQLDIPYDELAPYLNNDLETILVRYMGNAIKRAEYARRFGANEEDLNKLVASMVDEIDLGQRNKVGALNAQQAMDLVYDVADMMQGEFAPPITRIGGVLTRSVLNLQVMIKLPLAVLSSMPEFLTPGILSQSPSAYITALIQGVGAGVWEGLRAMDKVITGKHHFNQSDAYQQAEEIGVIAQAAIQDALDALHFAGESSTDLLSVGTRKFMQITLQEQTMRLQKTIAVRTFMKAVRQWSESTQKANSEQLLKDFGIDPQEAQRWARAGFPDNDPIQFAINRGAIRFANSAITTPDSSVRSRGLQRKYAGLPLLWQFQSFSNAFGNTMLRRIIVQGKRAKNARQLVIMTGMIMMMAAAFAAQELRDWWKFGDKKPYKDDTKNDPSRRTFNSFAGAGFTGMFSRLFELISPYKFGYGQQGAARIGGLWGPTATDMGKVIDAFVIDQGNDKKQADMQARFITNMVPIVSGLPYQVKQDTFVEPISEALR